MLGYMQRETLSPTGQSNESLRFTSEEVMFCLVALEQYMQHRFQLSTLGNRYNALLATTTAPKEAAARMKRTAHFAQYFDRLAALLLGAKDQPDTPSELEPRDVVTLNEALKHASTQGIGDARLALDDMVLGAAGFLPVVARSTGIPLAALASRNRESYFDVGTHIEQVAQGIVDLQQQLAPIAESKTVKVTWPEVAPFTFA